MFNWEQEFDSKWLMVNIENDSSIGTQEEMKIFISDLLSKARAEGVEEGIKQEMTNPDTMWEQSIRLQRDKEIIEMIDVYITNGEKAIAEGSMSQFGSASGGMMATSALKAFQELKSKLL